jgi:glycosyltransferase involved in cell wall biosynthesis
MRARICVVTAGHLATCPRMLKAADALANAGYQVRVVSARYMAWATEADTEIRRTRVQTWDWAVVDYRRDVARSIYLRTGLRFRHARSLAKLLGPARGPLILAAWAYSRAHTELLRAALAQPADLFYGGTTGALAAVAEAARRTGAPYALDLEDFHSAEQNGTPDGALTSQLAERIERSVLPTAVFLTTASGAIAEAYTAAYGVQPIPINNTFPLPFTIPDPTPILGNGLRLYWFSQTIGPQRGLEDAVKAMGLAAIPGELHLRGRALPGYIGGLQQLAAETAPQLRIVCHEPAPPDAMIDLCRGYDVGLALEQPHVLNRALCLTNKAFTYMLAGLAVAFTDTRGQRPLALDIQQGALLYTPGDVQALAAGLQRWASDKASLRQAKTAAWEAATRRWHWEHPCERGALLHAVNRALHR